MDLGIAGHVAIVQGATKGIGRGIAEALAAEGVDLLLTARTAEALDATAKEIAAKSGRRVAWEAADSADLGAIARIVERAKKEFGRVDIVVCNSGGPSPGGVFDLTPEQWRAANELLYLSPVTLLKEAMPLLEKSPAPRFFVVTSSSTREPVMGLTLSNTFRPGVAGLIKTLAQELAPKRVRCHCLSPGRIDTERLAKVFAVQAQKRGVDASEVREASIASIPAGRIGNPADMGAVAAFLSSPKADYLTGMNWLIDGGLVKTI